MGSHGGPWAGIGVQKPDPLSGRSKGLPKLRTQHLDPGPGQAAGHLGWPNPSPCVKAPGQAWGFGEGVSDLQHLGQEPAALRSPITSCSEPHPQAAPAVPVASPAGTASDPKDETTCHGR